MSENRDTRSQSAQTQYATAPAPLRKIDIWVTTSGNFSTQALHCTMPTMGAERVLFAADYPYEDYAEAGEFIETVQAVEGLSYP